ncbi:MAG: hypothetical protein KDD64_06395 [Bdellovibrionales bacterium]|nr:hypothetical protein [Bdellovibrionales bacterium]
MHIVVSVVFALLALGGGFLMDLNPVFSFIGALGVFIVSYFVYGVITSKGPIVIESAANEAVQNARTRLNSIRISAINAKSDDMVDAASDLSAAFEEVFQLIERHRDGYSRVGLTLALLKPLVEASELCAQFKGSEQFPEMAKKFLEAKSQVITDLKENAEGLTADDVKAFEVKVKTIETVAANN